MAATRIPWLHVIAGCMSSGKTAEVVRLLSRREIAGQSVLLITPARDTRVAPGEVVSRTGTRFPSVVAKDATSLRDEVLARDPDAVAIEEAQFFDDLVLFAKCMVENFNKHVVVVGLDGDSERRPFGQVLDCIPLADKVTKLVALCARCNDGTPALFSYRKVHVGGQVLVGGADSYAPYCRKCYVQAPV